MPATLNTLPDTTRFQSIELLNAQLATALDLQLQAKQAHWNVKGPNFMSLREFFDQLAEGAEGWTDILAERLVAIGGVAKGTLEAIAAETSLPAYPLTTEGGLAQVRAMASSLPLGTRLLRML